MDPIITPAISAVKVVATTAKVTATKIALSDAGKGVIKEVARNSISSLKTSVAKGEILSPIKSKEVTYFIKSKVDQKALTNKSVLSIFESIQKPSEGITTLGKKEIYYLNQGNIIKNGDLYYKGEKFGSINENTRNIYIDRNKALDSKGINTFLSHTKLAPNATYNINHGLNKTIYKTDGIGRCFKVENISKETGRLRNISEQVKALRTKNEQTLPYTDPKINDQSGHFIASSNGGIPESINLFPQAHKLNNSRAFREMEKTIKSALDSGKTVQTNVDINYKGLSYRPDNLTYKVQIDGGKIMEYKYNNINLTQNDLNALR